MIRDINNVIRVPVELDTSFFKYWLEFIRPFHQLAPREIAVMASLLNNRFELSKVIKDSVILEKVALNEDAKDRAMKECNMSNNYLQVILGRFRKKKIIGNEGINPRFVPNIDLDNPTGVFKLLLLFEVKDGKD